MFHNVRGISSGRGGGNRVALKTEEIKVMGPWRRNVEKVLMAYTVAILLVHPCG